MLAICTLYHACLHGLPRMLLAVFLFLSGGLAETSKVMAAAPAPAVCRQIYEQFGVQGVGCPALSIGLASGTAPPQSRPAGDVGQQPMVLEPASVLQARRKESHIFFPAGGSGLDPAAMAQLVQVAQVLQIPVMQGACVSLVGHSDSVGSAAVNQTLSEERARGVADYLHPLMRKPHRIVNVSGVGEARPLADTDPAAPENRRVEIWLRSCGD